MEVAGPGDDPGHHVPVWDLRPWPLAHLPRSPLNRGTVVGVFVGPERSGAVEPGQGGFDIETSVGSQAHDAEQAVPLVRPSHLRQHISR